MKRNILLTILILAFSFAFCAVPAFADGDITVYLDNEQLSFDVAPLIADGRVLVPMRGVFEALGADVSWDDETKTAVACDADSGSGVTITIGSNIMLDNEGNKTILDVPARIENGRTLLPLRAVAEAFDCIVEWNDAERAVYIVNGSLQYALDMAERQETVEAANAEALLNAIGTDKKIVLTGTYYNLSDDIKVDNPFVEQNEYDSGYTIKNVSNMMICGNNAQIVIDDIYADVLLFKNCEYIELKGISVGHIKSMPEYMCEGSVTTFYSCSNIYIEDCDLYGCGAFGIYAYDTKKITVSGGKIHDCSYTGIWLSDGSTADVSETEFCDSNHMSGFIRTDNSKISLTDCSIHDIVCEDSFIDSFDSSGTPSDITIKNCTFEKISYGDFINSNLVNLTMDGCVFKD